MTDEKLLELCSNLTAESNPETLRVLAEELMDLLQKEQDQIVAKPIAKLAGNER